MQDYWIRRVLCVMALGSALAVSACDGGSSEPAGVPPAPPAATLDASFGVGGIVATLDRSPPPSAVANAIAIQPDGKILAAGSAGYAGTLQVPPAPLPALVRYNRDGTLDLGFGNAGTYAGPSVYIGRIALQRDGKIVVLASNGVMRVNANGTLDVSFGTAGTGVVGLHVDNDTYINDLALQPDGGIVLAGHRQHAIDARGVSIEFLLLRLSADGIPDPSFGQGAGAVVTAINETAQIGAIAVTASGAIIATGESRPRASLSDNNIAVARYDAGGTLDTSFGVGGVATAPMGALLVVVNGVALQPDGRIVVAGAAGELRGGGFVRHVTIARFLENGTIDPDFGSGGIITKPFDPNIDEATAVAVQSNGKIVAVGYAGTEGTAGEAFLTARFDRNGTPDLSFGTAGSAMLAINGSSGARSLAIGPDGRIVVGGAAVISATDLRPEFALIRYLGDPVPGVPQ